jgi:hypothetical protein
LKEEEKQLTGWSKSTIDYVTANRSRVQQSIRGIAKGYNKILQRIDVDDIYSDLLYYLYSCDDYNIEKAYDRSSTPGTIVSIEGYIHCCVKYCVVRYITKVYNEEKDVVRESIKDEEGKELSLYDTIADNRTENDFSKSSYDLDSICKSYESKRYAFGPDIFQIWFIRLETILNKKQDKYNDILVILGISKREINQVEKGAGKEEIMISIAKAITLIGIEEAINIIREYTYCADKIEEVIELF